MIGTLVRTAANVAMAFTNRNFRAEAELERAKSSNFFIAGARPFLTWVFGVSILYYSFICPTFQKTFDLNCKSVFTEENFLPLLRAFFA